MLSLSAWTEVHLLRSALGMKNGLSEGVLGSQARLLHQLSKASSIPECCLDALSHPLVLLKQSQEESTSLAVQLSENQQRLHGITGQLEHSFEEIARLQKVRDS